MNRDLFIDAMGNLPDDIIYNVDRFETKKKVKNRKLIKYGSLAAGLLLIFTVGIIIILGRPKDDQKNNSISSLAGGYMINGIRYQLIENMADRVIYDDYPRGIHGGDRPQLPVHVRMVHQVRHGVRPVPGREDKVQRRDRQEEVHLQRRVG